MPLYDFECRVGHVTEVKAGYDVTHLPCPTCGREALRLAVYREQYISGETVPKGNATREGNIKDKHGRTRLSVFQEASQEIDYAHTKAENEAGRELPSPNLYKKAVRAAKQKGVNYGTT